jgi:microcompartment protein CcmL/EutN
MENRVERKCIGLIEAIGMASAIEAADAAVKSGNVKLLGIEYSGYRARIVVKIEGNVGAVKAAVRAAAAATECISGSLRGCQSSSIKAAIDGSVYETLIRNKNTIGDEKQIASGKRPQGTNKKGKWVGHWKQKGYIYE